MVAIKKAIEPEIKRRSRDRMSQGGRGGNLPHLDQGKSRDQVADYVGVSGRTLEKAERVVDDGTPELVEATDQRLDLRIVATNRHISRAEVRPL